MKVIWICDAGDDFYAYKIFLNAATGGLMFAN